MNILPLMFAFVKMMYAMLNTVKANREKKFSLVRSYTRRGANERW